MIDWSKFDQYPEDMVECRCGAFFRSHVKFCMDGGVTRAHLETRKPCPACGKTDNACAARGEPEMQVIGKKDVQ